MSRFSAEWLQQRSPFDAAARDAGLAQGFAAALRNGGKGRALRIVDLGAGAGANFRVLAPFIGAPQDWILVDNDPLLLAREPVVTAGWRRCTEAPAAWRAQPLPLDLADRLEALDFAGFDGVTASALFDLVSSEWIADLAGKLGAARRPFLAALSVDGRLAWTPAHPDDDDVAAAFARDQRRDKGFGAALGGTAPQALIAALERQGFAVEERRSDWRLGREDEAMLTAMVTGIAGAARATAPAESGRIDAWRHARLAAAAARELSLSVGHRDVLALP